MVKIWFVVVLLLVPILSYGQALDQSYIGYVNPLLSGANCTGATLQAAANSIGAGQKTLYLTTTDRNKVDCVWNITSDVTLPANVVLKVPFGAKATIPFGVTLTVEGCVDAAEENWATGNVVVRNNLACLGASVGEALGHALASYASDGCFPSYSGTTVTVSPCDVWMVKSGTAVLALRSVETAVDIVLPTTEGRYWIMLRETDTAQFLGWTCSGAYCYGYDDERPYQPGLFPIARIEMLGNVINKLFNTSPRRITKSMTIPSSLITDIQTPWVWAGPDALVTVAAGFSLTLGSCPVASRMKLFGTGDLYFGPGACGAVQPEWFGADPTGMVDSTAAWNRIVTATARFNDAQHESTVIACEGTYRLSGNLNSGGINFVQGMHIVGTFHKLSHPPNMPYYPCTFQFYGTGNAFHSVDTGASVTDMVLHNVSIQDMNGTAQYGILCWRCTSGSFKNIITYGFDYGFQFANNFYYGEAIMVKSRHPRKRCADWSANVNFAEIDAQCSATDVTTLESGLSISLASTGWFGTSRISRVNFISETSSGIPIFLGRIKGGDINAYIETPGTCSNFSADGVLQLTNMTGGNLNVFISHTCTGTLPIGLKSIAAPLGSYPDTRNLSISGWISATYDKPVVLENAPGAWGINLTALNIGGDNPPQIQQHTTGIKIADNVITHGAKPDVNMGRDDRDSMEPSYWRQGDMVFETQGFEPPALTNVVNIVTQGGANPLAVPLMLESTVEATGPATTATPSLLYNNIRTTHIVLDPATPGTNDITDFGGYIAGQCLHVRLKEGAGVRRILQGVPIRLKTGTQVDVTENMLLMFCVNGGVWREVR